MATLNHELLDEILALPADMRSQLVEKLINSLNAPIQKKIDHVWVEEAERRFKAMEAGISKPIDGDQAIQAIKEKLKR